MARPREFDTDKALRDMTALFWEHGYAGASMHDIERVTGLRKQSLYRAFGDKRGMYLAALAAYERDEMAESVRLLGLPGDAMTRFARLFRHVIDGADGKRGRRGCFLCNASIDQAPIDTPTGKLVADMMNRVEAAFAATLDAAAPLQMTADNRRKTARGLMAGYFGLHVLVKSGAVPAVLKEAADRVLAMLRE